MHRIRYLEKYARMNTKYKEWIGIENDLKTKNHGTKFRKWYKTQFAHNDMHNKYT